MRGSITFESEPDKGTNFTIRLPDVEIAAKDRTEPPFNPSLIRFEPARIQIVDDIEYNRDVLAAHLQLLEIKVFLPPMVYRQSNKLTQLNRT